MVLGLLAAGAVVTGVGYLAARRANHAYHATVAEMEDEQRRSSYYYTQPSTGYYSQQHQHTSHYPTSYYPTTGHSYGYRR